MNFFKELKILNFFFFLKNLEILNFFKELKILNFFFFWKIWKSWIFEKIDWWNFFFFWKIWKSWILSRNWKNLIDDFFLKNLEILNFFKELKILIDFFFFFEIWRFVHYQKSEEDEDEDGVKVMKIYSWSFFFFEKLIIWMRTTLAGSWCKLPNKSFSIPAKR